MSERITVGEDLPEPKLGKMFWIGRKLYGWCGGCRRLVRVNKPIIGSLHSCERTTPARQSGTNPEPGQSATVKHQ